MKALNKKERKKANVRFIAMFMGTLLLMFCCSYFVLRVAHKGVGVLETKHTTYTKAFENQALVTFRIEEIIDKIYSLKKEERTINEQKNLQGLISGIRLDIEKVIEDERSELEEFSLYEQLLVQISVIQTTIDLFEADQESRKYSQQLLERCRQNYRENMISEGNSKEENE